MFERGNITINVENLDRSVDFYTNCLGFKLSHKASDSWAEVEASGIRVGMHQEQPNERIGERKGLSIGLQVKDIDLARDYLSQQEIKLSPVSRDGPVLLSHFEDPDGNPLHLSQYA